MTTSDHDNDLIKLFADENILLEADGEAFVSSVERKIKRRTWQRWAVLLSATFVGVFLALIQAPDILMALSSYTGFDVSQLQSPDIEFETVGSGMMVAIVAACLSLFAVMSEDAI